MGRLLLGFSPLLTCKSRDTENSVSVSRSVGIARYVRPYLRDLYQRRLQQGPEPYRHRSVWKPWNYEAEILAFRNRINEDIDMETLRLCLTDRSFAFYTDRKDTTGKVLDNTELAEIGIVAVHYRICLHINCSSRVFAFFYVS